MDENSYDFVELPEKRTTPAKPRTGDHDPSPPSIALPPPVTHWFSRISAKMWVVGVGLALVPVTYGLKCVVTEQAAWLGDDGPNLEVHGDAALAMGIACIAVGLFIHAQWFWDSHPRYSFLCYPLTMVSCIVIVGSLGFGMFKILI